MHRRIRHLAFLSASEVVRKIDEFAHEIPVAKRPPSRPEVEYRLQDSEANTFALSQTKGREVDVDNWERAA